MSESIEAQILTVYYAHCQDIYGTRQEERDIQTLLKLNFEVVNPGDPAVQAEFERWKNSEQVSVVEKIDYMRFFEGKVGSCQALAFRALPSGMLPAGVAREVEFARSRNLPVFELPAFSHRQRLTVEQTREYLHETGQR